MFALFQPRLAEQPQVGYLSVGPHWRQQFTCPTIHVLKYSLSLVRAHTPSRQLVEASELSFVFYGLVLRHWLCWIRERGVPLAYVTTHNSTDRCRANHEASLVTQIIRLTCRWVAHSKRRRTLEATRLVMANLKD
ncbi:Down syndrome cell adhesion molecule homolog [Plakobranchus ocellatus]|uniref:Down syndrome cell adhesion molecule homolog n=1 Tax=Plakobranchus ocellatus TaxID=259542 RepID=A0AAV3XK66_9GAST|nr:Down syndrome cell adhesion molecule homolog [Plakobranchus ocellatus]